MRTISILIFLILSSALPVFGAETGSEGTSSRITGGSFEQSIFSGFNFGLGGAVMTSEYKGMEGDAIPIPLLGYEGDYLYLRGVSGGVHAYRNDWLELNAEISYMPLNFFADDSESWAMRRLDDRYSTLMAGINGVLRSPFGNLSVTASTDILGYSNGILVDGSYAYPIKLGRFEIEPAVGAQYNDANFNRYYYGIDHNEARKSHLSHYDPADSVSPYAQLSARVYFSENWSAFTSGQAMFLNQEIYDSPMVDDSEKYSISLGVLYAF